MPIEPQDDALAELCANALSAFKLAARMRGIQLPGIVLVAHTPEGKVAMAADMDSRIGVAVLAEVFRTLVSKCEQMEAESNNCTPSSPSVNVAGIDLPPGVISSN